MKISPSLRSFSVLGAVALLAGCHQASSSSSTQRSEGVEPPAPTTPKRSLTSPRQSFAQPVPRAIGPHGRTIAEVFAQRQALAGKRVTVQGRVVRVARNILGKNWVRLQDGTATGGHYELVVTTQAVPRPGDIVQLSGVLRLSVNLGAGYYYPVLLEEAAPKTTI